MASQEPVLKLLPCYLSKENCLHIGLSWWGIKGIIGSSHRCSCCGYFKVLEHLEGCSRNGCPTGDACGPCAYLWGTRSRCARLQLQLQDCSLVVTQLTLDKGRNGSHSIVCKVTCCLLSLFLLHSFYLYLNVLGNRRTNVQVKMQ